MTITDHLKNMTNYAIERYQLGDEVLWDITLVVVPQSPPAHFITMLIPAASQIGEFHQAGAVVEQGHKIDQEDVDGLVRGMLESLRTERTKYLTGSTAPAARQEAPSPGLIIP